MPVEYRGFLNGVRPTLARGYFNGKGPQAPAFSERGRLRRSEAKASRQSRDRLKGQPQERQHSAAEGGTRDRLPPGERLKSNFTTRWYQFCICDIVSMLCMSIPGVCMFTEPVFYRGRHGQESEEGKEDREGSHQEGGKEDFKEKEVVVSATERLRLRVQPGRKAKPLQRI
jgi:hypothetical protein